MIALFLKTRVFHISWKAEKREIKKFLKSRIWRFDINCDYVFVLCVSLFFLQAVTIFVFYQRVLYYFIVKIFFRRTEAVVWECPVKKACLKYLAKSIRKHLWWSSVFQWSCRIETCKFIKERLRHRCFLVNIAKKKKKKKLQKSSIVDVRLSSKYTLASGRL